MYQRKFALFVFSVLLVLYGCKHRANTIQHSVYYWKTNFSLSKPENDSLKTLGINRIYARFFDVVYDEEEHLAMPVADIQFQTPPDTGFEITPVVFIKNAVLQHSSVETAKGLGQKIARRIRQMADSNNIRHLNEVQLDCDWTPTTRDKFFALIEGCKKQLSPIKISCTIRLHQFKYYTTCGVPPVDRGMLMFYNMGDLSHLNPVNSIYDSATAASYLGSFRNYPLPLDIAVPLFDLAVLYHHDKPVNTVSHEVLSGNGFQLSGPGMYRAMNDTIVDLVSIRSGDWIKWDKTRPEDCLQAARQINSYKDNNQNSLSVSIFDLQPASFFTYDTTTIQKIYSALH